MEWRFICYAVVESRRRIAPLLNKFETLPLTRTEKETRSDEPRSAGKYTEKYRMISATFLTEFGDSNKRGYASYIQVLLS